MPAINAPTEKQTGLVQPVTFVMRKATTWKDVVEATTQAIGGMSLKDTPANVEIGRIAGDVITVTSITLRDMLANVETEKLIGDVLIVIKIIQRDMPVSAIIEKLIGNAIIVIGILQLDMPAENVVKNDSRKPFIQINHLLLSYPYYCSYCLIKFVDYVKSFSKEKPIKIS